MSRDQASVESPSRRVVLFGASNLIRGISPLVETCRQVWGSPLDVLAAAGHGRSYGSAETRVLMRGLPGIQKCGIWRALENRSTAPTATLLTDIGNDILYGTKPETIARWVGDCLERVTQLSEHVVITELPLESIARLQRWKFYMMRSIFFPSSRLKFDDAAQRAQELNERVIELAERYNALVVRPRSSWYGFDPIHIRRGRLAEAWSEMLPSWSDQAALLDVRPSVYRWLLLRSLRPEQRTLFGVVQRQAQPAATFADGTTISFF